RFGTAVRHEKLGRHLWMRLPAAIRDGIRGYLAGRDHLFCRRLVLWIDAEAGSDELPWEDLWVHDAQPTRTRALEVVRYVPIVSATEVVPCSVSVARPVRVLLIVGCQEQGPVTPPADSEVVRTVGKLRSEFAGLGPAFELTVASRYATIGGIQSDRILTARNAAPTEGAPTEIVTLLTGGGGYDCVVFAGHSDAFDDRLEAEASPIETTGLQLGFADDPVFFDDLLAALGRASTRTRLVVLCACKVFGGAARPLLQRVEQVIAAGAVLDTAVVPQLVPHLFAHLAGDAPTSSPAGLPRAPCPHAIGGGLAAGRRALPETHAFIPVHWVRHLADQPFATPDELVLFEHRAALRDTLQLLPRALTQGLPVGRDLLTDVYVDVHLGRGDAPRDRLAHWVGGRDRTTLLELVDATLRGEVGDDEVFRYLLRARPGAGKTTTLKWIAVQVAASVHRDVVPIFLRLQDLVPPIDPAAPPLPADRGGWLAWLAARVPRLEGHAALLQRRRLLLLLDGLDEVS
ncbi:MAG: hypothetical protein KDC87_14680, partial [Planctomycetes bacterium]|nr:hypothetical protein [Planctomycetota bacterium]